MEMEFAAVRLDRSARVGGVVLGGRTGWNRNQRRLRDKEQKKMQDEWIGGHALCHWSMKALRISGIVNVKG